MVSNRSILWCAGALAACGTAALASHSLLHPEGLRNEAYRPASEILAAPSSVDTLLPDLPGPIAGLDEPLPLETAIPSSLFLFSSFSPVATADMLRGGIEEVSSEQPRDTFRDIVRQETAARDPSLSSLSVPRPPPRPAFIEARVRSGSGAMNQGFDELRAPRSEPALSDAAGSSSGFTWPFGAPEAPDMSAKPGRSMQSGMASWYGPGFHGRKTASGEIFNQNALTAAHPRLPFGTRVRVVDEKTGRSVVVRINDRGPYAHGRIIDLSKGSAQALGMLGVGRVKIVSAE